MKKVFSFVCVLGFTLALYGQVTIATAPTQVDAAPATSLQAREIRVGTARPRDAGQPLEAGDRVIASGSVEIRIGSTLVTADEAEIRHGAPGEPADIELRGNVHLKTVFALFDKAALQVK